MDLLNTNSMTSSYRRIQGLMLISVLTVATLSAQAQGDELSSQAPTISRVCLWNADNTTWKTLGLKRSQIARMQELRLEYPAVVDGQWVGNEEDVAPAPVQNERVDAEPNISTSIAGPAAGAAAPVQVKEISTQPPAAAPKGLQYHMREVLTPVQLQRWAKECDY